MKTFSKLFQIKVPVLHWACMLWFCMSSPTFLFGQGLDPTFYSGASCCIHTLAMQPGNQILAGGMFTVRNTYYGTMFRRFNPNGLVDTSFPASPADNVTGSEGWRVLAIAEQLDGKLLVAGSVGIDGPLNFIGL